MVSQRNFVATRTGASDASGAHIIQSHPRGMTRDYLKRKRLSMMKITRKGFIPVMLTPFESHGEIDFKALNRLTRLYLETGAAGLFANCLSSEMYELSTRERLEIIHCIVEVAAGSVPVVATGSFGSTLEEQADFIKKVYDQGVHAVILITSLLAAEGEPTAVLEERIFRLIEMTPGVPLGFYECPVPYKRVLSPEQLGHFAATGRVIYHKDTSLDIAGIREKIAQTKKTALGLYDAYMGHAVLSLQAGAAGLSCIQGNFFPELIVWLCDHFQDPALQEEVGEVQQFFIHHMDVMHHVYPVVAKYFLQQRGLDISTFTRRQVGIYSTPVGHDLERLNQDYLLLQKKLELGLVI